MLGGVEVITIGGDHTRAQFRRYSDEQLNQAVQERMADPIASARAQQRIVALAQQLPRP